MSESPRAAEELALRLTDPAHFFNAPRVEPSSPSDAEALGVSGLEHLLGLLHLDKQRQRARLLTLLLPAAAAAGFNVADFTRALRRHIDLRLQRERRELQNTYRYGWRVAGIATLLLATSLGLSSIFASDLTESMRPLLRKTFEYGFEIIGWVIMWHPVDVLVFNPLGIRARIAALQTLASVAIEVREASAPK